MPDFLSTEILIQTGAVGISLYLIYSHIIKDKQLMKLMTNHFEHDLEQREKDNESRDTLSKTLQSLIDIIKSIKK